MSLSDDVRRVLAFDGVPFGIESEAEWERARTRAVDEALCKLLESVEVRIGGWMSAALEDPNVCAEMKADINDMFSKVAELRKAVQSVQDAK